MKISAIIPLYNKEKHIQRAIQSVLAQTYQDFELIIVDDGSTDASFEMAGAVQDPRIRIIRQENQGVSAARNRGVAEANSDWVAFLDADDEWLPDFLSSIFRLRSAYPDENVFCTCYFFQDPVGEKHLPKTINLFTADRVYLLGDLLSVIRIGLPFDSSSFSLTKQAFLETDGFPTGVKYQEDVDFWIKLSLNHNIVFLNTPLAVYHQDSENRACDKFDSLIGESFPVNNLVQMMRNDQIPNRLRQSAIEYVAKYQIPLAKHYLLYNESKKAKETLRTCSNTRIYLPAWLITYLCSFLPFPMFRSIINIKNALQGR